MNYNVYDEVKLGCGTNVFKDRYVSDPARTEREDRLCDEKRDNDMLKEHDHKPLSELKDSCLLKKGEVKSCFECPMQLSNPKDCHLTIILLRCMYCKRFYGWKDGLGKSGIRFGVCENKICRRKACGEGA